MITFIPWVDHPAVIAGIGLAFFLVIPLIGLIVTPLYSLHLRMQREQAHTRRRVALASASDDEPSSPCQPSTCC